MRVPRRSGLVTAADGLDRLFSRRFPHAQRLAQWHEVLAGVPVEQISDGMLLALPVAAATSLSGLIVEQQCCPFHFQLDFYCVGGATEDHRR